MLTECMIEIAAVTGSGDYPLLLLLLLIGILLLLGGLLILHLFLQRVTAKQTPQSRSSQHGISRRRFLADGTVVIPAVTVASSHLSEPKPLFLDQQTLASTLIQLGAWREAERVARSIEKPQEQCEALRNLANALEQAGKPVPGLWQEAERAARSIKYPSIRAMALEDLAKALAKATHWAEAERIARSLKNAWGSPPTGVLEDLAKALAEATHWAEAERIARSFEDPWSRAEALRNLANALAKATHWAEAERIARSIEKPREQCEALRNLAMALEQAGKPVPGLWQDAERIARSIKYPSIRAMALEDLANALAKATHWAEAERIARSIEDPQEQGKALLTLIKALVKAGEQTHAWTLMQQIAPNSVPTVQPPPPPQKPTPTSISSIQPIVTTLDSPEMTAVVNAITLITVGISTVVGTLKLIQKHWAKSSTQSTQQPKPTQIVAVRIRMSRGDDHAFEEWVKDPVGLKHYIEVFSDPDSPLQPLQVVFVQANGNEIRIDVSKGVHNNAPLDEVLKHLGI